MTPEASAQLGVILGAFLGLVGTIFVAERYMLAGQHVAIRTM